MAGICGMILMAGCAGGDGKVYETTYTDGMVTGTAVMKEKKNGGWQTVSGDPVVAVNNGITTEDQLPYGGGNSGLREAQDEAAPIGF